MKTAQQIIYVLGLVCIIGGGYGFLISKMPKGKITDPYIIGYLIGVAIPVIVGILFLIISNYLSKRIRKKKKNTVSHEVS